MEKNVAKAHPVHKSLSSEMALITSYIPFVGSHGHTQMQSGVGTKLFAGKPVHMENHKLWKGEDEF